MSRVYPAITILCVTMVADGQFRIFPEVPVKAIRADNQTQAISEIGCNRTCYEVDQSPRLASFVPIIEIFTAAYRTSIDNIVCAGTIPCTSVLSVSRKLCTAPRLDPERDWL